MTTTYVDPVSYLRVVDAPARVRTVMVYDWRSRSPWCGRPDSGYKLKKVRVPRLVFVMDKLNSTNVYEAEDDGKPLSIDTRVRSLAGRAGNIGAAGGVCFGTAHDVAARVGAVATFWNTRFDYFEDRRPSKRFTDKLGELLYVERLVKEDA